MRHNVIYCPFQNEIRHFVVFMAETKNSPFSSLKKNCLRWRQYLSLLRECMFLPRPNDTVQCPCPDQRFLFSILAPILSLSAFLLLQLRWHTLHSFLLCLKFHFTSACPILVSNYVVCHMRILRCLDRWFVSQFWSSFVSPVYQLKRHSKDYFLLSYFPTR